MTLHRVVSARGSRHHSATNTRTGTLFLGILVFHVSAWIKKARRSSSMLSQVELFFGSSPCMDIRIHLCKEPPVFSNAEVVSGHVVLASETQADIATVAIRLSGSATSRVHSGRLSESHQLCRTSEQLFPPSKCASAFTSRSATLGPGEHVFAFSIRLPQTTQCYSTTTSRNSHHLMHKLPPSTGGKSAPEEIKYVLEATVQQGGLIRGTRKATRCVNFHPVSTIALPPEGQHVQTKIQRITYTTDGFDFLSSPSTCEVSAKLLNGPFLFLGQPIPLAVEITNTKQSSNDISLHDFQSMLFETTEVRARGAAESLTRPWMVQTVANLRQPFVPEFRDNEKNGGPVFVVNNNLWSQHHTPPFLAPTFETSNISRSYKLEIRLGIGFGGNNTKVVEFQFPVYIVSLGLSATGPCRIEGEMPVPEYCEKEVLGKLKLGSL